jgi:RNA 3'-terminal phosphate cyclase (ATP)
VADRELAVVREQLSWREDECSVEAVENPVGPGNALLLKIDAEHITEVFTSFGERGRSAEEVARGAAEAASSWLRAEVPVDEHLADQLLIPMALAGGGWFRTVKPSLHSTTNATIIQRFLPVEIRFEQETAIVWRVVVTGK